MTIKEAVKGNGTMLGILACSGMIKKAETMLSNDENVEFACVYNVYTEPNNENLKVNIGLDTKKKNAGVIVLTNKRIFFLSSILGKTISKQIKIQDIQSVDYKTTLSLATIRIKGITEMIVIEATKKTAEEMIRKISDLQSNSNSEKTSLGSISQADELLKFKKLLDEGIITQEEFERKKQQLLK